MCQVMAVGKWHHPCLDWFQFLQCWSWCHRVGFSPEKRWFDLQSKTVKSGGVVVTVPLLVKAQINKNTSHLTRNRETAPVSRPASWETLIYDDFKALPTDTTTLSLHWDQTRPNQTRIPEFNGESHHLTVALALVSWPSRSYGAWICDHGMMPFSGAAVLPLSLLTK